MGNSCFGGFGKVRRGKSSVERKEVLEKATTFGNMSGSGLIVILGLVFIGKGLATPLNVQLVCPSFDHPPDLNPVPRIKVTLRDPGSSMFSFARELSSNRTDQDGKATFRFEVDEPRNPDLTLRVIYDYSLDEDGFLVTNDWKTIHYTDYKISQLQSAHSPIVALDQNLCNTYLSMMATWIDYLETTNRTEHPCRVPINVIPGTYVGQVLAHWAWAYATTDTIRVLRVDGFDAELAKHEFAHTLRACTDGSYAHLLLDSAWYSYVSNHWCGKVTNEGMAFNEGFAEYWAGSCVRIEDRHAWDGDEEEVRDEPQQQDGGGQDSDASEAHVARTLNEMGRRCHGNREHRGRMLDLLEENSGAIHTLGEFVRFHREKYSCE